MHWEELQTTLRELIAEHGDLPVFDEDLRPVNAWAFLKAEDSDEGEPCVYFESQGDEVLKASEVIGRYERTRDQSGSNEVHPWDEQYLMTVGEADFEVTFEPAEGEHPAMFTFA